MIAFSKIGESCTPFEEGLVQSTAITAPKHSRDQLVLVAKRIGASSFALMLDEFGNGKVYMPSREKFFGDLFRPLRIQMAIELRRAGLTVTQIAQRLGVSERTVDADFAIGFSAGFASQLRREV